MTKHQMRSRRSFRFAVAGAVGSLIGFGAILPSATSGGVAAAATNSNLSVEPASGSTISGTITFKAPAPGCGTIPSAVVRMKGPGITGDLADDTGFTNITGAVPLETPSAALTLTSGGDTWDNIAINKSIPRPLNGTYTVKIQCSEDGETAGKPFFDKDITFTRSTNTYLVAGAAPGSPTPAPSGTPTPTPTPTGAATPTPEPTPDPTPDPDDTETDSENGGGGGGVDDGGEGLPNTGGRDPGDAMTLAALLLFSGLLFLALTVEGPRPGRYDEDDHR